IWDSVASRSVNGTLMHTQAFLSYHPDKRFNRDDRLIFLRGRPVAVFPLAYKIKDGIKTGQSPYGASFGGVVGLDLSSLNAELIAETLTNTLRENGYGSISLVQAPSCYERDCGNSPVNYFLLKTCDGMLADRGLCSVVPLRRNRFSQSFRRNVRKGERAGLTFSQGHDIDGFYPLLRETIEGKHGSRITHTRNELNYLVDVLGKRISIFLAHLRDTPVAGVLTFEDMNCVYAFYNAHSRSHTDIGALHALFAHMIDHYREKKEWMDLGLTDRLHIPTNRGLLQFKEGMGAVNMFRDYFELFLNP
ncbi:MAG: GNAT family N-acetyltransferase, partial [Desulfobacterales bacterium]|nr:GNAT family N-acetyltransferase [Desulfobacterales bacterium]